MLKIILISSLLSFSLILNAEESTIRTGHHLVSIIKGNFKANSNCALEGRMVRRGMSMVLKLKLMKKNDYDEKTYLIPRLSGSDIKSVFNRSTILNSYTYEKTKNRPNNPMVKDHFVISFIGNKQGKLNVVSVRKEMSVIRLGQGVKRKVVETIFNCTP